ncbi:hypothetical protein IAT38_007847 [Cryptococcus sp. DSM 104549]
MAGSPPLQRHLAERDELRTRALALPLDLRRDLAANLVWSLPRDEVLKLNGRLNEMLQKDIIGSLPPELAFMILGRLELKDLMQCALVSKTWSGLCDEQSLWAYICATSTPPIRPAETTWADLKTHLAPRPPSPSADSPFDDPSISDALDDRMGNHADVIAGQGGMGGGGGVDPLGMSGGLRRSVWERGGAGMGEGLPLHLQHPGGAVGSGSGAGREPKTEPVASHLAVPSAKPQCNFKHLYIVHSILKRRMCTPRPTFSAAEPARACSPTRGGSSSSANPQTTFTIPPPPIPRPRTIDAISSIKAGGLPGHSEAVYSLSLIHQPMKINMLEKCPDCHIQLGSSLSAEGGPNGPSFMDSIMPIGAVSISPGFSRRPHMALDGADAGGALGSRSTVQGRDWLLSGSRDKTMRLWQLAPQPRVVKIFHGGHTGSVLSHSVVRLPRRVSAVSSPAGKGVLGSLGAAGKKRVMAVSGGSDGKICLWDVEGGSGEPEKVVHAHTDSVLCVRANERHVASCSKDKTIRLFDVHTLEELLVIGGASAGNDERLHRGAVNAVALSKDFIISASGDKSLRVWSITNGDLLACIEGHTRGIASVDFTLCPPASLPSLPAGQLCRGVIITGSSDASIKTFYLVEQKSSAPTVPSDSDVPMASDEDDAHPAESTAPPVPTELLPDGHSLLLVEKGAAWSPCVCPPGLAKVDYVKCLRCYNRGHIDLVRTVYMGRGVILSGSYDSNVKMWDQSTGKLVVNLSGAHTGRVFSVVGDRTKIISSGLDCRINIWDFSDGLDTSFVEP